MRLSAHPALACRLVLWHSSIARAINLLDSTNNRPILARPKSLDQYIQYPEFYCTFLIAGGTHRLSRAWGFGAYRRMVTPRGPPSAGEGSQLDSLSLPGELC